MLNVAMEYNKALAQMQHVKGELLDKGDFREKPGHTDQWWRYFHNPGL